MTFPSFFLGYAGTVLAVTLTAAGLVNAVRDGDPAWGIAAWAVALCLALAAGRRVYVRWRQTSRESPR